LSIWMIDTYATINQVKSDAKLSQRIQFDNIPSGRIYLSQIIEAMKNNKILTLTYQGFWKNKETTFDVEPYFLKVFNCRWYLIAHSIADNTTRTYALDRISDVVTTSRTFIFDGSFDIDYYFEGCCGIIADKSIPIQRVVIRAHGYSGAYIATLPIHSSQKVLSKDEDSIVFEYQVRPTYDFLQSLLNQTDQIEVLEPISLRKEMKRIAQNILSYYTNSK
ncbi:MAG: WYL domain-containing protein, partial [Bacteroidales bacterium]|nr:WYL domain-containing protein [Bacteroidales bacterium]